MKANVFIIIFAAAIIANFCFPAWGTDVGGIIDTDTTWDLTGSPYILTGHVQIAEDVALKIEPGVRIISSEPLAYTIAVWGTVKAIGTKTHKVTFKSVNIVPEASSALIHVEFAEINEGVFHGRHNPGSLVLKDSVLRNINYEFRPRVSGQICIVKRNFFSCDGERCAEPPCLCLGVSVFEGANFIQNVFLEAGISIIGGVFENNFVHGGLMTLHEGAGIKYNSFSLLPIWLSKYGYFMSAYGGNSNAAHNYWGTTDTETIDSVIYDKNDDLYTEGYIVYTPYLENKHPDTSPMAYFRAEPTMGQPPLKVKFTDQSLLSITSWEWDFGDGSTSSEQNPSHTFGGLGNYTVSLTISDILGLKDTYKKVITLRDKMPTPHFLLLLDE